jgi:hypothetical protein
VSSLGSAYEPSARLPEGETLEDLLESDAFESARSIVGSLLKIGEDGSEQVDVPEDIDYQTTKLLEFVDNSAPRSFV